MITASSDKSCRLWDTDSGACLQTMEGHTDEIFSCAFNYEVRFYLSTRRDAVDAGRSTRADSFQSEVEGARARFCGPRLLSLSQ